MNRFEDRRIWPSNEHGLRIFNFCDRLSGFRKYRGLAENFGPDSGIFMSGSSGCRYQKEVWIT